MKLNQVETLVLIPAYLLFFTGVALAIVNPAYFRTVYVSEDGILEWLTVLALGSVAAVSIMRLWQRPSGWRKKATLVLIALLAVFGVGEELSWGQRIFDIQSSTFFQQHNAKEETNIHNLVFGGLNVNTDVFAKGFLVLFLLYVAVLTPLYHRSGRIRSIVDDWAIPVPRRYQWAGYLFVIIMVEGLVNGLTGTTRRGELTEFMVPVLVTLNIIFPYNREIFAPSGN